MKTKRIFALVSAATIMLAGMPAHAVFAKEAPSVDEVVANEAPAVEETVTDSAVSGE